MLGQGVFLAREHIYGEQSPKERLTIRSLSLEVPLQVLFALTATLKATAHT